MRIVVTGGRDFQNRECVYRVLDHLVLNYGLKRVAQGGAAGADQLTREWCRYRDIECVEYKADWMVHGKKAGPMRNMRMLEAERPDLVVSFPGSRGTIGCTGYAQRLGLPVHRVTETEYDTWQFKKTLAS